MEFSENNNILDLTVYSDGSLGEDENAGTGYCIYCGPNTKIAHGRIPSGHTAEVYNAKVIGATEGLKAAIAHVLAKYASKVTVYLDNEEAGGQD